MKILIKCVHFGHGSQPMHHAMLDGHEDTVVIDESMDKAIGKLVRQNRQKFGIEIETTIENADKKTKDSP